MNTTKILKFNIECSWGAVKKIVKKNFKSLTQFFTCHRERDKSIRFGKKFILFMPTFILHTITKLITVKEKPSRKSLDMTGLPTVENHIYPKGTTDENGVLLDIYEEIGTEIIYCLAGVIACKKLLEFADNMSIFVHGKGCYICVWRY